MRKGEYKNIAGEKYGRLTTIERVGVNGQNRSLWLCKCDCGNDSVVSVSELLSGGTRSCGCLRDEKAKNRMTKHGLRYTRIYNIWLGIKRRIFDANCKEFYLYGGRGITMCDEWRDDFTSFYNWSMNNGYSDNLSIDRIDTDGGYFPNNCRWATAKEQACNRRPRKKVAV